MNIKKETTERGFGVGTFTDLYGMKCSIQQSSVASKRAIWLGIDDPEPKILACHTPQGGTGWVPYEIPDEVLLHTRMHLDKEMAQQLIKVLQEFVDTGEV